jgi:tetratricopeptide (TPR) repeat protein
MHRILTSLLLVFIASRFGMAQSTQLNVPMEMQVNLSFDDNRGFRSTERTDASGSTTQAARVESATPGEHGSSSNIAIQIRVQLQDEGGANLDEKSPSDEGKIVFQVMSLRPYRIRVFGAVIDEAVVDDIIPGRGDRLLSIRLHYKGKPDAEGSTSGATSVTRLQIPPNAQKELDRGNAALGKGDLADARKRFEKAVELYPKFDQAYNNLGVVLMQSGDKEGGFKAFSRAIELNDHFARAYLNLAKIALADKKYAEADGLLRKCLSNDPVNPQALLMAAQAALLVGKPDDTIADVHILHSLEHSEYAVGHYFAALALESEGRTAEALQEYTVFLKEAPNDPNVPKARERSQALSSQNQ